MTIPQAYFNARFVFLRTFHFGYLSMENTEATSETMDCDILTLCGFQVFDQPVSIPLAKLTLMFGPNSAGKSAVNEGLELFRGLLRTNRTSFNEYEKFDYLRGSWRKIGGNPDRFVEQMTIGLKKAGNEGFPLRPNLISYLDLSDDWYREANADQQFGDGSTEIKFVHRLCSITDDSLDFDHSYPASNSWCLQDIHISISHQPILQIIEGSHVALNISHEELAGLFQESDQSALLNIPGKLDVSWISNGWLYLKGGSSILNWRLDRDSMFVDPIVGPLVSLVRPAQISGKFTRADQLADPATKSAFTMFGNLVDAVMDNAAKTMGGYYGKAINLARVVPASRMIPTDASLVFQFPPEGYVTPVDAIDNFYIRPGDDGYWRDLAYALLPQPKPNDGDLSSSQISQQLAARVNRALSNHLFLDAGYQVAADVRVILDLEQFLAQATTSGNDAVDYPTLVRLLLVDSRGRRFSFSEVGSGIGYVLPVICAAYSFSSDLTFIEQPELHLHPALQAALGDVFIEAMNDEGRTGEIYRKECRLIIETHSEHVLLRILKRIRQTASDRPPLPELRISPKDVLVLYFDPHPDGTTQVKQLRISPDGEFLDSWPRGFFDERYQELFDE